MTRQKSGKEPEQGFARRGGLGGGGVEGAKEGLCAEVPPHPEGSRRVVLPPASGPVRGLS